MTYDYLTINYAAGAGIIFMLIFLHANASLERSIKKIFYLMITIEIFEMLTYSLELWTTTFERLSPLRLWLSAVGYSIRPVILCLILMLAMRNTPGKHFPKVFYLPCIVNTVAAFSVFFTDIVYSYTPDNRFVRGPLGYFTHAVALLYLIILMVVVIRNYSGRAKLETLIIFAVSMLIVFSMVIEALYQIRTVGRTSIVMIIIFYYMFFQTQIYKSSLTEEQSMRQELEQVSRSDGLTGVLNKRAFEQTVGKLLSDPEDCIRLGFVFLDMDRMKELNDTLGHAAGDVVITDTARSLQRTFRNTDLIGRFGGDEFCVFVPDMTKQRLLECLQSLQTALRKEYGDGARTIQISGSIGAVHTERMGDLTYEQLLQLADEALYEAKASGRDCFVLKEI